MLGQGCSCYRGLNAAFGIGSYQRRVKVRVYICGTGYMASSMGSASPDVWVERQCIFGKANTSAQIQ
jgi:hypothetical protein